MRLCLQVVQVAQLQTAAEQAQLLQVGISAYLHVGDAAFASRPTVCRRKLMAHKSALKTATSLHGGYMLCRLPRGQQQAVGPQAGCIVALHLHADLMQVDEATAALRFDNSELEALPREDLTDSDDEEVVGVKLHNHSEVVSSARARIRRRGVFGPIDEQLAKLSLGSSPLRSPARWGTISMAALVLHEQKQGLLCVQQQSRYALSN